MRRAAAALAAAGQIFLLPQGRPAPPPPPLQPALSALTGNPANRLPGPVRSSELVDVALGGRGRPASIVVTQRLRLSGSGDYSFAVYGSVRRVVPTADSDSQPGLLALGIVWQGFSDRRRTLGARATLDTAKAAPALPIVVRETTHAIELRNATTRHIVAAGGSARRQDVAGALARVRGTAVVSVPGRRGSDRTLVASAPLRVTGRVGRTPIDSILRGTLTVPRGTLDLRVSIPPPREILPTRAQLRRARDPLRLLQQGLAEVQVAAAYRQFLASPDQTDPGATRYRFHTVSGHARATTRPGRSRSHSVPAVLWIVAAAAALLGAAALWARS